MAFLYWELSSLRRYAPSFTLLAAILCLYLSDLAGVGVLLPDEPRYLAIGRAMAQSGDWITPRLWGSPWFEKPPLLYWMTAMGARLGLGPEMSGRLPVALLSLLFLTAMYFLLRVEWGSGAAAVATGALASSAWWFTFSSFGLTDLPIAAFFSLAVLLALPLIRTAPDSGSLRAARFVLIGVSLGLAALAKGLVPIALAVPFVWYLRHWWRSWIFAVAALLATAGPWYLLVYLRNGQAFLDDFFWKHHFERLYSPSLQHVEPFWYYLPVLVAALFPWTPAFFLLFRRREKWLDQRMHFLAACIVFGMVLFSVSLNKLPGYILPLLPPACVLLGVSIPSQWEMTGASLRRWLVPSSILIGLMPLLARWLPAVISAGRLTTPEKLHFAAADVFYMLAPLAAVLVARRSWIFVLLVLCFVAGGLLLKIVDYPVLDRSVSARGTWQWLQHTSGSVCDDWLGRNWEFGLAFYRGEPYPVCGHGAYDFALQSHGRDTPILVRRPK